jgi:aminopeptidase N
MKRLFILGAVVIACLIPVDGQTAPDRARVWDILNYTIRVSFDAPRKIVYGDTTVSMTPLNSELGSVELDAVGMQFKSVRLLDGASLSYKTLPGSIIVSSPKAIKRGESIAIRFIYTITNPKKGVNFIEASTPNDPFSHPAQIWTQNEPEDARYWFPSFDFPSDKATSEQFITVKKGETAIGNGKLVDVKTSQNGTVTFQYRMDQPYSTYLASFVVGKYTRLEDSYRNVPLGFYAFSDKQRQAKIAFAPTKEMMTVFESVTDVPFAFPKYDQIMVSGFEEIDGMENITATTLADNTILLADFPFGRPLVEDLVSHELAHSWFGNLVTCRNWSELWLNESFATFMEAVWREKSVSRAAYLNKLMEDRREYFADDAINKSHHPLQNLSAAANNSLFDVTTYQKGSLVIHMLRQTIGDAAFWKGVNLYLTRHRFDNVVSADLQAAMEEASGQRLQWFFDQWIYSAGYPRLEIRKSYNPNKKELALTVSQVQKGEGKTPSAFNFPLEIEIATESAQIQQTVNISKREETFTFEVPTAVSKIIIDPSEKVILKSVKILD